ncbi:ABC transporter [Streptomyces sp. Ru73]|uniref:ABC transporter n=1 Tax=Streptomyces sp. Ru73 TaxID=2080748 RepID=UPI000CDDA656|nr:ABC transporter [Streptomyces sp. Ru73]POX38621.1 ABC transporter [Streptomyces sp. Ru73]
MTPLLRYYVALLIGSHRWLPPTLVYAAFVAIGIRAGDPVLDGLGYAAAPLLPVAAWLVRAGVTAEPPAARACTAAAAGPGRAHLAAVLAATLAATVLGVLGTAFTALVSDPRSADHRIAVPLGPAVLAGALTALCCVLLGTAVGALANRPVLHSPGWAIPTGALAALMLLVAAGSPANAAVSGLVTGSSHGTVTVPWLPLGAAALIAVAAVGAACVLSSRRT